jgi:RNA recognition motif-containing protein
MRTPSPQLAAPLAPIQQSNSSTYVSDYGAEAEDGSGFEDFEFKSVYVRNLPSDISASEIEEEFKNFGTIKPDGVFLRTRKVNNLHFVFFLILFSMFILSDMKSQN